MQVADTSRVTKLPPSSGGTASFQNAKIFFALLLVYLTYSRLLEFVPVPLITLMIALVSALFVALTGNFGKAVKSRAGIGLLALTFWICAGIPFSVWPGGAFHSLKDDWLKQWLMYYVVVGGIATIGDFRKMAYALAYATATIVLLGFRYAGNVDGRMLIGAGTLGNPNSLAMYLLIGAPFCVYALMRANLAMKFFWLFILANLGRDVLRTGSRAALLAAAAGTIYVFSKSTMGKRAALMMGAVILAIAATLIAPETILNRYQIIFSRSGDPTQTSAEASREARIAILKRSLIATAKHPLFGVGFGQFPVINSQMTRAAGIREDSHGTHNMYTQVSSELGIPGIALFAWMLVISFRAISAALRKMHSNGAAIEDYRVAQALQAAWVIELVNGIFSHDAYSIPVLTLLGLSEVIRRIVLTPSLIPVAKTPEPAVPLGGARVNVAPRRRFQLPAAHNPILRSKQRDT